MTKRAKHARIPDLPYIHSLLGARLFSVQEEKAGMRPDFVVRYHELCPSEPPQIFNEGGKFLERVKGTYLPRCIRFTGVRSIRREGLFNEIDDLSIDHPLRNLRGVLSWISQGEKDLFSLFAHGSDQPARLWVTSQGCQQEEWDGLQEPVELLRDWSPPPPFRPGLVLEPKYLHRRYGGDPIPFQMGGRMYYRRLFLGSIEYQTNQRPRVDAVLNVGEEPSVWAKDGAAHPSDRWITHGEGSKGMSLPQLVEEANWVIERLQKGQRVLVHCVAGLNRSTSVCCAVLILLEGLSEEAALDRVRDHHAWARPDDHHWLILKGLALNGGKGWEV